MTGKLVLAPDNRTKPELLDEHGVVIIKIFLAYKGHSPAKGNITRTLRVTGRVSEVHAAILNLSKEPGNEQ